MLISFSNSRRLTITCSRTSHTSEQKMDKSKLITWESLELAEHTVCPSSIFRFSGSCTSCCLSSVQRAKLWLFTHRAKQGRFSLQSLCITDCESRHSKHWQHSPITLGWFETSCGPFSSNSLPIPHLGGVTRLRKAFAFQKSNTANYLKYLSRALFHYS